MYEEGQIGVTKASGRSTILYEMFLHNVSNYMQHSMHTLCKIVSVPEDYTTTNSEGVIHVSTSQPASVLVMIVADSVFEPDENFLIEILLPESEDRNCVILQPNAIDITIRDNIST